ncbi:LutB/LldF family L-lactate oxidation iron-sulfur protein [Aneurinibacillus sp. Ricciae_BoGa-3]|uniref:LutB/LldF family L-lactate oxidation iron-sulfur protein n=1 Tax=Aneurinibacillus sp. Ricciae_BoGa-3 TaxID=3022697 RepID=UPI0023405882|nr:LutB/LldF family L-lactate oxidation iron-sulfur protein [Aneurinibacillus sp. Ricciae_BoGa-3]WCK54000.1 LutB/LldF family L-lactate oxidation iron-sulfur protein [Aneurinibacillus sp. Ricciae_BoGa-3]
MSDFNPTLTLKERAEVALNDEFLRNAVKFTTQKLRTGKKVASDELGNWEDWRERARAIRLHTIAHLDYYLGEFIKNARANGVHVHIASNAEEAVDITMKIAASKEAKSVAKSKSMVSEELHINHALEQQGIEAVETDLGEYIIQLAGETPSHLIIPAIHKNKQQVADLFSEVSGETLPADTKVLAGFARAKLREKFLEADIGMTGCNFAIAETGSMVLFSNEGNARMVSTLPKTQITYMGMERIIPSLEDLEVMATMLPRSATGQKLTVYMSTITGPRRAEDSDGPEEMHIIIIDNGRSEQLGDPEFQEVLNCIRCGACLNACPVYRHVGGHTYGWVYSGPIGAVLTPRLNQDMEKWGEVAYASSLCGACHEACPVKIPLHDMLVYIRRQKVEEGYTPSTERMAFKGFKYVMSDYRRFKRSMKLGKIGQKFVAKDGVIKSKMGPLKGWNTYRDAPTMAEESFRESWSKLDWELSRDTPSMDPEILKRMNEAIAKRGKNK